ncbi:carbohydrate ABC transporter permease [Paenibacillus sp. VMFN-D1]|uniref:carbohydrate ABC transporter permease n=1 Tax=Paenibacillus sp. VMFN-D1 TaxID=2135608 RepID=UPI000E23096F|nr:carbohydrate ABC transporter permease [Paenibacillus sp. VMFN-D1]RED41829.1 putative aldouronate transport system permease protein [Paenibacillus sp. VMFN-D1]
MYENKIYQAAANLVMFALSLAAILPFILLFIASISDENSIVLNGYTFWPEKFSLDAYLYMWNNVESITRAYGITIVVTVIGTFTGLLISTLIAYPLSRSDMPMRSFLSFFVFFTLLFNGGLVPTYLIYTEIFQIKNTLAALIVPGLLTNGFFILLIRSFFSTTIPNAVIESAYIDGAGEFKIFYRIVMPLSLPILATIGLMLLINYWNDWFNGLIYITDPQLYSIQNLLNRMLSNIQFLQQNNLDGNASQAMANLPMNSVRMAMAVIGILPIICVYPYLQKYFVKGLVIGAVKG